MADAKLKVNVQIASIAIARPGDTLFIGFAHELDEETIEALEEHFQPYVDAGIKIGYLDQVSSMVILRPDEAVVTDGN